MSAWATAVAALTKGSYWLWLRHGEPSGSTATDSSGGGHHGTYSGATPTLAQPGALQDDPTRTSVKFTGASPICTVAHDSAMDAIKFSVVVLFKSVSLGAGSNLLAARDAPSSNRRFFLTINGTTGVIQFTCLSTATIGYDAISASGFNDGQWHMLIGVWDQSGGAVGRVKLYVDGALLYSGTGANTINTAGTVAFTVGNWLRSQLPSNSLQQETLYLPGVALTATDRTNLWNAFQTPAPPGPPTSLTLTGYSDHSLELSWSAPTTGGTFTGYEVRIDGGTPVSATSPHDFTGLTGGTEYDLEVRAVGPGGSGSWALLTVSTIAETPPGHYRVELTLGDHSWSVERGDTPAMGPTLPMSLGWNLSPGAYFPSQPDLTTLTFDVLTADASDLVDVVKGTPVSFRMYVTEDPAEEPWQEFDGVVTQLDGTDVPSGVEGVRNFRATVFCADWNAALADAYVGYAFGDWPAESIKERIERIATEIGADFFDQVLANGAEGGLVARPARAISALAAIRESLKDAATEDIDGADTWYGRPVFRYVPADPSIPADPVIVLYNLRRRVFPDRTQTLDGRFVRAGGQWTKQPGPVAAEWVIVDGGVYGTPGAGVPIVINTSLDDTHADTPDERGHLGNSLLPDGSTALDGWNTRTLRYLAGYVNPEDPDDYADPAPVFYWASFAPLRDGGALPPIVPVVITPIGPELEVNGVDYIAGTLTGARLVIPPGGAFYVDFSLRAELLPGSELP